jgi:hypothetical protein
MQKPDKVLRFSPLVKVVPATEQLQRVILLHPDPIRHEKERKYCFCKKNATRDMVLCDECHEWYHHTCVGLDEEQARADDDWCCGYCVGDPDESGNRTWQLEIPQNGKKRKKAAPDRNDDDTPKALGYPPEQKVKVKVGPADWAEIQAAVRDGGKKINLEEQRKKRKVEAILKEGGHHVVDEMSAAGLAQRAVDGPLVDDLEVLGLLGDE